MTTIKMEGFKVPGAVHAPSRPSLHRPFTDGSMTVDTNILASLDRSHMPMSSPFSFDIPMSSGDQSSLDHFMPSPHSSALSPSNASFTSSSLFGDFKFMNRSDKPDAQGNFSTSVPTQKDGGFLNKPTERSRSQSTGRNSRVGKAPSAKGITKTRKLSMSDSRPPITNGPGQARGRSSHSVNRNPPTVHPRTMSHSDILPNRLGLGVGLDTHKEGERTDSISPPDYMNDSGLSFTMPRSGLDSASWTSSTVPSLLPGSYGSYSGIYDDTLIDSPITPAHNLSKQLPHDELFKKAKRRECHNQVEKRRREHINAKIEELSQLLPPQYSEPPEEAVVAVVEEEEEEDVKPDTSPMKKKKNKRSASTAKQQKDAAHCKGRILSQSVRYIHDLRQVNEMQAARIQQLESIIAASGSGGDLGMLHSGLSSVGSSGSPWSNELASTFDGFHGGHLASGHNIGIAKQPDLVPVKENHQLDVMRPSPESQPEQRDPWNLSFDQTVDTGLMAFDPSPRTNEDQMDTMDPMEHNAFRRSSSLSTSESLGSGSGNRSLLNASDSEMVYGSLRNMASPRMMSLVEEFEYQRGRQRERLNDHGFDQPSKQKADDADIHLGMSGMDLDAMFTNRGREEDAGGMRW